jgi:uncharacterized protein
MNEANIELVRAAMDAFGRSDLQALRDLCHPDLEVDWSRRLIDPQVIHGLDEMGRFLEEMQGIFDAISFEELEISDYGDDVLLVSTGTFRGRASGLEVSATAANLWTIRDGKIARFRFYQTKDDALAELTAPPAPPRASAP